MADHLHTRIVDAVKTLLDLSGEPWESVFAFRVHPASPDGMPYLSVWIPSENVTRESGEGGADTFVEAEIELMVAGFIKEEDAGTDAEAALNEILKRVQQVLSAGITLDSDPVNFDYRGCEKTYEGADQDYSEISIRFAAEIAYQLGSPDTLAWQ